MLKLPKQMCTSQLLRKDKLSSVRYLDMAALYAGSRTCQGRAASGGSSLSVLHARSLDRCVRMHEEFAMSKSLSLFTSPSMTAWCLIK